jgi:hypothetical protein
MNHQNLFGIAAIIFSGAIFVHSLKSANAFPQGPSVSYGGNPLFSQGGTISNSTSSIFTAPSDQIMVVTDLLLSMNSDDCQSFLDITLSGTSLGSFKLHSNLHYDGDKAAQSQPSTIQHAFNSGISVPVGETLEITETGSCSVAYTLSGYYAQP